MWYSRGRRRRALWALALRVSSRTSTKRSGGDEGAAKDEDVTKGENEDVTKDEDEGAAKGTHHSNKYETF